MKPAMSLIDKCQEIEPKKTKKKKKKKKTQMTSSQSAGELKVGRRHLDGSSSLTKFTDRTKSETSK